MSTPRPIVPWIGGKRRLLRYILPLLPEHTTYVEPFVGGGAVFFAKEPAHVEVINDFNNELVTLYRVIKHHLEEFIRHFKWALVSRQEFLWAQSTRPEVLTDIQRAARFFFLQRCAFGGKVAGQTFGVAAVTPPRLNLLRLEEELSWAHLRLSRCYIERLPWADCMGRYDRPGTLFYLDPPYWQTEGYGVDFPFEEYERMAVLMRALEGRVIMSINDHPDIRRVFVGFPCDTVSIRYTVNGARRAASERSELVIRNW